VRFLHPCMVAVAISRGREGGGIERGPEWARVVRPRLGRPPGLPFSSNPQRNRHNPHRKRREGLRGPGSEGGPIPLPSYQSNGRKSQYAQNSTHMTVAMRSFCPALEGESLGSQRTLYNMVQSREGYKPRLQYMRPQPRGEESLDASGGLPRSRK